MAEIMTKRKWEAKLKLAGAQLLMGQITQAEHEELCRQYDEWKERNRAHKFRTGN